MGQAELLTFLVPLWAVLQGASPAEIGLLVGAKSLLTFFLAIHGGAMMDRLGTRRVMLFFTATTGCLAALYPFLPWLPVMVVLQMMIGFASNMTWIGAQTMIAQVTGGDPAKIGRFSFFSRIGNVIAPVLMGLLWDFAGPTAAFFGVACWSSCMFYAVSKVENPQAPSTLIGKISLRDVLPKLSDYTGSIKLVLIPAVAFTLAISFTRHATNAAENSFLIVYLRELGFSGTLIGAMFSTAEVLNGIGSLFVGRFSNRWPIPWLMIGFTAVSIILLAITPLLGGVFVLLALAQCVRRMSEGLVQPLMFSLQSRLQFMASVKSGPAEFLKQASTGSLDVRHSGSSVQAIRTDRMVPQQRKQLANSERFIMESTMGTNAMKSTIRSVKKNGEMPACPMNSSRTQKGVA